MSFQEYWSGLPFPPPGDLPDSGIELASPELQADSLPLSHQELAYTLMPNKKVFLKKERKVICNAFNLPLYHP